MPTKSLLIKAFWLSFTKVLPSPLPHPPSILLSQDHSCPVRIHSQNSLQLVWLLVEAEKQWRLLWASQG